MSKIIRMGIPFERSLSMGVVEGHSHEQRGAQLIATAMAGFFLLIGTMTWLMMAG